MAAVKTRLGEGGRVVIPAEFRKALDICPGDQLLLILENGGITVVTPQEAIRQFQDLVRPYKREGVSEVDDFIAERHAEAARE